VEPLFVVAKTIGSPGKNDSLLFHSKLFKLWLWPLQSFERDDDHYSPVAFGNARTKNFVTQECAVFVNWISECGS